MKQILLMIGVSVLLFANFTRNGDIVTDTTMNLQWQDNNDAQTVLKTWIEAINYCENLTLGGYSDWRLPNINELKTIADETTYSPAIVDAFTNVSLGNYWSSTTYATSGGAALYVHFDYLSAGFRSKQNQEHVRCVRTGR